MNNIIQVVTTHELDINNKTSSVHRIFSDSRKQLHSFFYAIVPICFFFLLFSSLNVASAYAGMTVLDESFSNCTLPDNWTVTPSSNGCQWFFNGDILHNDTGGEGCYAMADSDACEDPMDTILDTRIIDCSELKRALLTFKYDMTEDSFSTFRVAVSNDGGTSWSTVLERTETASGEVSIDVSDLADGKPQVLIRFQYVTTDWEYAWQIDDVKLTEKPFPWAMYLPAILGR